MRCGPCSCAGGGGVMSGAALETDSVTALGCGAGLAAIGGDVISGCCDILSVRLARGSDRNLELRKAAGTPRAAQGRRNATVSQQGCRTGEPGTGSLAIAASLN